MASTRQLRGGDFVVRVDEEELDILMRGITMVKESAPDFSKVPQELRAPLESTYQTYRRRLDKLDEKLTNISEPWPEHDAEAERALGPEAVGAGSKKG